MVKVWLCMTNKIIKIRSTWRLLETQISFFSSTMVNGYDKTGKLVHFVAFYELKYQFFGHFWTVSEKHSKVRMIYVLLLSYWFLFCIN